MGFSKSTTNSKEVASKSSQSKTPPTYSVYSLRWLIQACCCLVAFCVPLQWISYVPVNQELRTFYCSNRTDLQCDPAFITNQIFQVVGVLTGIAGMYITDQYGIRLSIMSAVTTNIVGALLRVISAIPAIEDSTTRISILYTGTTIVSIAQSFYLVLPCKIAQSWFSEDQRATANVMIFLSTSVGAVVGTLIPSLFFDSANADQFDRNSTKFLIYNSMMLGMCVVPFILSFFIRRSEPPTPPSASNLGAELAPPFWKGIICCLRIVQFHAQLLIFGLYFALLWGIMVVLPDMLTIAGYNLSGYPIVSCSAFGAIFSLIAARIADKTKKFAEIMKISGIAFFTCALGLRLYLLKTAQSPWDTVVVLILCGFLGGFSTTQIPIGLEIGVETTFPVYEATSSGLLVLSLQIWMFIFYYLFEWIKTFSFFYDFNANSQVGNWKLVLDVWVVISLIMAVFTFIFLKPKYNRIDYEKEIKEKNASFSEQSEGESEE